MASQRISGILGRKDAAGDARAALGVFGKHPGWNDHIDDIGLSSERLVQIKRVLYVEGIGGNIDAGEWDKMSEGGRLPGFEHLFLWRWGGEIALGRFWSSRDGKGRTRYPMVACAHVRGQPVSWQVRYLAPMLERLEEEFKAAGTAERVIALSENALREIEAMSAGDPSPPDRSEQSATAELAAHEAMGPERRGMYRLLYQMERELSSFMRGGVSDGSRTRVADLTPRHLRVPRCVQDEGQSVLLWWRFLTEHIGDSAPVVLLSPRGAGFIDILVGDSGVSQFTCVRAGEQTIPLTTEIPYSFDAEFVRRAEARIAGAPVEVKSDTGRKIQQAGGGLGGALEKVKAAGAAGGMEPRQIAMIAGVAVLGLVLIGGMLVLVLGGGTKGSQSPTPDANGGGTGTGAPGSSTTTGANFGPQQRADFAEWCAAAEWALVLRDRLAGADLGALKADPYLNERVVPLLERLRTTDLVLDPRRVATGGARQLSALGNAPPASAQTDEAIARTASALEVIRGLRASIEPSVWPARATVDRVGQMSRQAGWVNLSGALEEVSRTVSLESAGALSSLERVSKAASASARLESAWQRYESAHRAVVEGQGAQRDPRLEAIPALLARVEITPGVAPDAAPDAVAAAAGRLESIASLTGDVARTVQERWGALDMAYFLSSSGASSPDAMADEAALRAWIQEARRDTYTRLDPADDPRRGWDVEARASSLRGDIESLRAGGAQVDPADIAALERGLDALREKIAQAGTLTWDRSSQASVLAAAGEIDRQMSGLEGGYDRLTGRLTEQWDRETSRLRDRAGVAGVTSPALLGTWRQRRDELLAMFTTPDKLSALNEHVEALETFLIALERALPVPSMPRERPSVLDADVLERAIFAERERAIAGALVQVAWREGRYEGGDPGGRGPQAGAALQEWAGRVSKAAGDLARVEGLLGQGYGTEEPVPGGGTMRALVGSASERNVGPEVAAVFKPLLDQVTALSLIESERDPGVLARLAGSDDAPIGVALAAWRGLGDLDWPLTPNQLRTDAELSRSLAARVTGIADSARRTAVLGELATGRGERWLVCAQHVQRGADGSALREVLALRESAGVSEQALPPALRFCVLVDGFSSVARGATSASDEAALKRAAAALITQVEGLGLSPVVLAPVEGWLGEVRGLAGDDATVPVIDPATLGPATVGWSGQEADGGPRVRFTSPDGAQTLDFVLVEPGDHPEVTEATYLCTTELSIAALQWAASQGSNLARLRDLTSISPPADGAGIKSWVFGARQGRDAVIPAEGWFLAGEVASGIQPWAQGVNPGRPGPKTPVTQIAPGAAQAVAEWLGCRLPTGAEWLGARQRYETGNDAVPVWNLRDNTWGVQLRHVRSVQSGGRLGIKFPDEGVFHPADSSAKTEGQAQTLGTDDGSLFFDDVDRPRGRTVLHMVGNAAEYVLMGEAPPQFGVVGASALSAPEDYQALQAPCVVPAETVDFGWSDVGVRLAFSATAGGGAVPLWRRVQRLGTTAPVLLGVSE